MTGTQTVFVKELYYENFATHGPVIDDSAVQRNTGCASTPAKCPQIWLAQLRMPVRIYPALQQASNSQI